MIYHSGFTYPYIRMDIVFNQSITIVPTNRDAITQILQMLIKDCMFIGEDMDGLWIEYYQSGIHKRIKMTEDSISKLFTVFYEDKSIDNVRLYKAKKGYNHPICIQYLDANPSGIVRIPKREGIKAISVAIYLGLLNEKSICATQEKLTNYMVYIYQILGGINANLSIHGTPNYHFGNCFESFSKFGNCLFEESAINIRGAFWSTIFSSYQLKSLGGIDALLEAIPFSKIQLLRKHVSSRDDNSILDFDEYVLVTLSDRIDNCDIEKFRILYMFLRNKGMIPDISRLKKVLECPNEEGIINKDNRIIEINQYCNLLYFLNKEEYI